MNKRSSNRLRKRQLKNEYKSEEKEIKEKRLKTVQSTTWNISVIDYESADWIEVDHPIVMNKVPTALEMRSGRCCRIDHEKWCKQLKVDLKSDQYIGRLINMMHLAG